MNWDFLLFRELNKARQLQPKNHKEAIEFLKTHREEELIKKLVENNTILLNYYLYLTLLLFPIYLLLSASVLLFDYERININLYLFFKTIHLLLYSPRGWNLSYILSATIYLFLFFYLKPYRFLWLNKIFKDNLFNQIKSMFQILIALVITISFTVANYLMTEPKTFVCKKNPLCLLQTDDMFLLITVSNYLFFFLSCSLLTLILLAMSFGRLNNKIKLKRKIIIIINEHHKLHNTIKLPLIIKPRSILLQPTEKEKITEKPIVIQTMIVIALLLIALKIYRAFYLKEMQDFIKSYNHFASITANIMNHTENPSNISDANWRTIAKEANIMANNQQGCQDISDKFLANECTNAYLQLERSINDYLRNRNATFFLEKLKESRNNINTLNKKLSKKYKLQFKNN